MREDVGLAMRQEFQNAAEAVEGEFSPAPAVVDPEVLAIADNFEITKAKIAAMKQACAGLAIDGIEDRKGYDLVHSRRMEVQGARTSVEKIRVGLKADIVARGKKIDSVAKELTALLVEIEEPLKAEEKRIDTEKERIKAEEQREKDAKLQRRIDSLNAVGYPVNLGELVPMKDAAFEFLLATATDAFQAKEKLRIEAEAALAKQEAERLEAERKTAEAKAEADRKEREEIDRKKAEQAAEDARLAEQRAALRKEQEEFEAKKRAAEQAEREKQIAEEAARKARAKAEQDAREAQERAAREQAEAEARRKAAEAAKPDAEKLRALSQVMREIALPKLTTPAGQAAITVIDGWIGRLAKSIETEADKLSPVTPKAP